MHVTQRNGLSPHDAKGPGRCTSGGGRFRRKSVIPNAQAQPAGAPSYLQAQAEQGHLLFNNNCAECHGPELAGALGPTLRGSEFLQRWTGQPLSSLYNFEHTEMPENAPGSLPDQTLLPITAYILQKNGYAPGNAPLDKAALAQQLPMP